jgi:UDP-glucose 4-epimerase
VRPSHRPWRVEGIRSDVLLHETNLLDAAALEETVASIRPEWIFHCAAHGAYASQRDVGAMVQTNIVGTANLLNACAETGFEAFVNAGSSSEYGFKDHAPKETELPEPSSPYAVTKASATLFCRDAAKRRGLRVVTLRLYSVYGPWEEPTRLIPALVLEGLEGRLPPLVSPEAAHDFIFVDDIVEAFMLAASQPEQEAGVVYNVGSGVQTTLGEAVDVARKILGVNVKPSWGSMPGRSWDTGTWVADSSRIRGALGWKPQLTFEDGFRKTADWFRENPDMAILYRSMRAQKI